MSYHELFVSQQNVFSGFQTPFQHADYVILGVPFDVTSTYRTGARFGPAAIRQASLNIETYSFRTGLDVEDLKLHDLGDLHVYTDTRKTLATLEKVITDILKEGKTPITIGGEHTITLGIMRSVCAKAPKTAIVSLDAHLDLRNEFLGLRVSHATFMRRIREETDRAKIIEVGTRAVSKEELAYAKKAKIVFLTSQQIRKEGSEKIAVRLENKLMESYDRYLSVDMDVLDPAFAPGAQNPEPDGIDTSTLLNILCRICGKRVVGFDVVEVAPQYDSGVSAIQAAKVIFEMLCVLEKSRKA
jgi:agmatinase